MSWRQKMKRNLRALGYFLICFIGVSGFALTVDAAVKFISIATGGSGGTYYIIGGGMGKIIEKYVPRVKVSVESTAASTENCRLVAVRR